MWLWTMDIPSGNIVFATHIDPVADMFTGASDDKLADYVKRFLPQLREPFFLVIHPSSVHTPRRGLNIQGPFVPASEGKSDRTAHFNAYKNAVFHSDLAIADILHSIHDSPFAPRTVVVYTSDHGEAFWEHGQGCEHGCSVFDEEIRVPTWIDAPPNTLSDAEINAFHSAKSTPFFHVDLAATLLDLLGLWDTPSLSPYRRFMIGQPLTREGREERIMPLTNVSHVWERGLASYGLMRGTKKLAGMHRDGGFSCWNVQDDPLETRDVMESCGDLLSKANELYGRPPGQFDNLVFHSEWGPLVKE
jgi:arylsulfatase A-like enzyme